MKIKLLCLFTVLIQTAFSQSPGYYYSSIQRPVRNKQDSLLLIRNEQKMWVAASKGNVLMFDNPMLDCEFKVRMSKMQVEMCFKDSIPMKSGSSLYMMNLMENRNADTCYIMSFSPFLTDRFQLRYWVKDPEQKISPDTSHNPSISRIVPVAGHWEMGPWQEGISVKYLMPLSQYPNVIPAKEMAELNKIYREQFAAQLGGQLSGDTIFRTVRFTRDSNEYLPQAPYAHLLIMMSHFSFAGEIRTYSSPELAKPMSKVSIENTFSSWDSTNQVEDPNNPGVFIIAPLKRQGQIKTLLVYEKWNFFTPKIVPGYLYPPAPYLACRREVCAYGLLLDNGKALWYSSADMDNLLRKSNFNMAPYKECFRAERFKTLQVQVRTW